MGMLAAALMVLGLSGHAASAAGVGEGQIGVRYLMVPEGMVLTRIHPQMGAAAAGLVAGDLVVSIDGQSIQENPDAVGRRVRGAVDTKVKLKVRGPLGAPEREVAVTRSARVPTPRSARMDRVLVHFRASLNMGKGPEVVEEATESLIAASFLGKDPAEAIGSALNKAASRHPRTARAALPVLARVAGEDAGIHQRLGEAYLLLGDAKQALYHLQSAERFRGPDIQGADFKGNIDARYKAKEMLIEAVWKSGDKARAHTLASALALTRQNPRLLANLKLTHPDPPTPVRAHLPPLPPIGTTLLDGTPWKLQDHRGRAVLMAFWASWCGPCKREMPEIKKLWAERDDLPFDVLAVSVDKAKDRSKAVRAAKQWGMTFPVAHDPGLGQRLGVQGLPAVRLIGPSGADRYLAKGYSPTGIATLSQQVDAVLAEIAQGDQQGQGQVVGQLWSRGPASVSGFIGVPGARSIAGRPGGAVVGVRGSLPVDLVVTEGKLMGSVERDVSASRRGLSTRVGWLDGVVAAKAGGWWIWREDEGGTWLTTLTSPLQDMAVSGQHIWVAMEDGLAVLDRSGKAVARFDGQMRDLSADGDGGVWAVDGETRYRFSLEGLKEQGPAPRAWSVSSGGHWGGPRVIQLVQGRFGPEGAQRLVAVRQDGGIIGLDGAGAPALSLSLRKAPVITAADVDGDSRDEVLVVIRGQGVATLKLELP